MVGSLSFPSQRSLHSILFLEKLLYNYSFEKTFYPGDPNLGTPGFSLVVKRSMAKSYPLASLAQKTNIFFKAEGYAFEK